MKRMMILLFVCNITGCTSGVNVPCCSEDYYMDNRNVPNHYLPK